MHITNPGRPLRLHALCYCCCVTGILCFGLSALAAHPHEGIQTYDGPGTCVACHPYDAAGMLGSAHYQWTGPTPNVPSIVGPAGKGERGFNTYCGSPLSSRRSTCTPCHAGNGGTPSGEMTPEQLANIDCLMCHQDQYKRKAAGPFETIQTVDYLGSARTYKLPVEGPDGSFLYTMDTANMAISAVDASRTLHRPTRASCLRCHANAAGTDGGKRGDISSANVNPSMASDFHMSPQGADLACQDCHQFETCPRTIGLSS